MKLFQYLDMGLIFSGSILVAIGLSLLGVPHFLVGGGVALITLGLYKGHK